MKLPKFILQSSDYADMAYQVYASQISQDYLDIMKVHVIPNLEGFDGMSLRELRVLMCIAFFEEPLTPGQIAYAMRYDPSTVTRAIAVLVKKELVLRGENIRDTRSRLVALTPRGRKIGQNYTMQVRDFIASLSEDLPEPFTPQEREDMRRLMLKLRERARALKAAADALIV